MAELEELMWQPWNDDYLATAEFEEDVDDDDDGGGGEESVELNVYDDLEMIIDETMGDHVAELLGILGRRWIYDDYPTKVIGLAHQLASCALSLEEAVNLVVAHLGAAGAEADQLSDAVAGYFRLLMREWVDADDEEGGGGGDEALSQFEMRDYNDDDVEEGEETDDCCICLERLRRGVVATLRCRHEFHGGCIERWLRRGQNFCPLCKARAMH
ncbi:RING-type E3 ubiquitin transferase [Salvia divinorum]|uniref:RING-type E3 ubiquitin transferase n=1 Tax=Salvia divinorum TaxID=28513 RepID=A0ABD1IBW1_SALDI